MRENPRTAPNKKPGTEARRANPERIRATQPRRAQTEQRRHPGWLVLACLLVPPLGMAYMWSMQRYSMRTRVALSVVASALLFCECYLMFYRSACIPEPTVFTPGTGSVYAPASATYEPTSVPGATDTPYDVVVAPDSTANTGTLVTPAPDEFVPSGEEVQVGGDADVFVPNDTAAPATGDTQVYTSEGSLFYHASSTCGDKSYGTAITLPDALANGLAPCNRCNPPSQIG